MDEKQICIEEIINHLIMRNMPEEWVDITRGVLHLQLATYKVEKETKELIPYEGDVNEGLIMRFLVSKRVSGRSEQTIAYYGTEIRKAVHRIGKIVTKITTDDIRLLLAKREIEDQVSRVTINNERRALSSFFTWLHDEGIITNNPMRKIETIKTPKAKKKAFTEIELEKIRNATRNTREKAIVELLCSTGCRVGELVTIKTEKIQDDSVTIIGKGNKERTVYINAKATIAIRNYLSERNDNNEWLFPAGKKIFDEEGKRIRSMKAEWYKDPRNIAEGHTDKSSIEASLRKIGRRAQVENVHPHRFRRTCATMALRRGMPIEQVSMMLGHEQISTTQIYLDIDETDLKQAHKKYVI